MVSTGMPQELVLAGCTPQPLMAYLKALGVFRLVAEQKDQDVRACWRHDTLALYTALDRDALVRFFLEEYRPTPVVAPWNRDSRFSTKGDRQALEAILEQPAKRFQGYKAAIRKAREIVAALPPTLTPRSEAEKKTFKGLILAECRNQLPEDVLLWLDAAYVLSSDGPKYPPLLGTGGNDGRLEFSNNFMQNLLSALTIQGGASRGRGRGNTTVPVSKNLLDPALFGGVSPSLIKGRTAGQFSPGSIGGPNATAGFRAEPLTNPWDYVLMIEGTLLFAGAVARRLSAESRSKAIFPFTVDMSAAGYGTAVDAEYRKASRSELWLPLWDRPATYREVAHVFAEGRAQLGQRQAANGTDFARAIAGLGVERGVSEFVRFGFLKRNGKEFIASPLGRFWVKANPKVEVLHDIDAWLGSLRGLARGQDVPEALMRALRQIDQAIIELCQVRGQQSEQETARKLQGVLIALGRAEAWLARSRAKERITPLSGLRREWLSQANDGSAEFRTAAAIASIQGEDIGPVRTNLEPVAYQSRRWDWANNNPSVVWQGVELLPDMAAVLERRCLEARMKGTERDSVLPLRGGASVPLWDILTFLAGGLDERTVGELVLPLAALDWHSVPPTYDFPGALEERQRRHREEGQVLLPLPYAILKLLFLPWRFRHSPGAEEVAIMPEPSILPLLRAGRAAEAYGVAWRRLYACGLTPLVKEVDVPPRLAQRLAAALLIPIRYEDMYSLADMALMLAPPTS